MQLDRKKLLLDVLTAIGAIEEYLGEKRGFRKFQKNKMLQRAIERELEIIREATNRLLKLDPEMPIYEARRILSLKNGVIHAHDSVDCVILWGILDKDIPLLKIRVSALLGVESNP